jgi:hypothetical protein
MKRAIVVSAFVLLLQACSKPTAEARAAEQPAAATPPSPAPAAPTIDWAAVDGALGYKGAEQPAGVHRYGMPRSDLKVTSHGVAIRPGFALGSYLVFLPTGGNDAVVMGDLVLAEAERDAVIAKLEQGGVEVTASHKHLLDETPRVWWTHVHGHGDAVTVARAIKAALALTATPPAATAPAPAPPKMSIDTAQIDRVLGQKGKSNGGIYQISVARAEKIHAGGVELPPSMGLTTAINFQPGAGGKAAVNGDFVMLGSEVNPVLRALEENGISIVELHNHLLDEEPRLFFMHFWGNDDAVKLARGLRAALDKTNSVKAGG